jgi:hypothetical protein
MEIRPVGADLFRADLQTDGHEKINPRSSQFWERAPKILDISGPTHKRMFITQYLCLTLCSKVLLQKLTGSQPVKKFPAFYGTRRFITAFTSARQLSLS